MWCHTTAARLSAVKLGRVAHKTVKKTDSRLAARLAALASLGASVVHFAVVPTHWHEWMPAGLFFASIALFQLLWARLVLARTTTPVLAAGIMFNLGAVALWALTRTAGAPFGPHVGEAEVVQAADLCAQMLQIYVVMGASWVWYRGLQGAPVPVFGSALVLMVAVGVVALASTVGVASGLRHGHHAPAGADGGHHGTTAEEAHGHHGSTEAEPDHHGQSIEQVEDHHRDEEPANSPPIESIGTPPAPAPVQAPPAPAMPLLDAHTDHDHDE